ncbi:MAG: hypothetical protein AAB198_04085 [Actinomycetota bacterium]
MNLRVATVLSAREWESRLVAAARTSASVRLVLRAFLPDEVIEHSHELDVVVVGSETPWVSTARLAAWVRAGIRVVGIHPMGDRPAADRLASAGVDLVLSDDLPAETILREIRLLEPAAERSDPSHPLVAVTSGGGAPGRTEIALALAWTLAGRARCTLVDADLTAPGLAVRLGIPPRPDLADAVDAVHETGTVPDHLLHPAGRLRIVTGSHRSGEPPLRPEPVFDVIDALRVTTPVVADTGGWPNGAEIVKAATTAIVVVDASPTGIVRTAALLGEWAGPPPRLVLNRVEPGHAAEAVAATRRWTGLDPVALVGFRRGVMRTSRRGDRPDAGLLKALRGVLP